MPKNGKPGSAVAFRGRSWGLVAPMVVLLAAACQDRARFTFTNPGDDIGPITTIDQPTRSDTTVDAGPNFFVNGRTIDLDGVDTVYFLVTGGNEGFSPLRLNPPVDTVRFGLPLTTFSSAGDTFTVQIYGVDVAGNQGALTTRRIIVR
jgi:hypothetical protein